MRLRCLIVDDNEPFLEIAAASLEGESLDVVGTATTSAEALRHVAEHQPDVVLVDINLGEESGFELARKLVARFPQLASVHCHGLPGTARKPRLARQDAFVLPTR